MSQRDRQREREAQTEQQTELTARKSSQKVAAEIARGSVQKRHENPEFLDKIRDADYPDAVFPDLEDELGPALSGAHAVANREPGHAHKREWLNYNAAERQITEHQPGRLLKDDPELLAVAQGVRTADGRGFDPEAVDPAINKPKRKRALRDAYDIVTAIQSLGEGAKGLTSLTEATAVSKVEKNEQESKKGVKGRLSSLYGD